MGFSPVHFTLPESKTIVGYKTHRLLSIARTYLFSSAPAKRFLPLLPSLLCTWIRYRVRRIPITLHNISTFVIGRERQWKHTLWLTHPRMLSPYMAIPPPRTENKQVTRSTELHVLDEYSCDSVNNRRGLFTTSSEKARIESNLSVVAFTFEPPLLPHLELSNKDPVVTDSSRCVLRGYQTSFNLYSHN